MASDENSLGEEIARISAKLSELNPSHMGDLSALWEQLLGLADDDRATPVVSRLLTDASDRLESVILKSAASPEEALASAGRLIHAAMEAPPPISATEAFDWDAAQAEAEAEAGETDERATTSDSWAALSDPAPFDGKVSGTEDASVEAPAQVQVADDAGDAEAQFGEQETASVDDVEGANQPMAATIAQSFAVPTPEIQHVSPPAPSAAADIAVSMTVEIDPELLEEYVEESGENLAQAEQSLLDLESDPDNRDAVDTVFRAFHTIKGVAAFLELELVKEFAHHAEGLLSRVREGELRCEGGYATLALHSVDMLRELTKRIQDSATQGNTLHVTAPPSYVYLIQVLEAPERFGVSAASPNVPGLEQGAAAPAPQAATEATIIEVPDAAQVPAPVGVSLAPEPSVAVSTPPQGKSQLRERAANATNDAFVRVRTDKLDTLLDMVGELVIAQAMVAQDDSLVSSNQLDLQKKISHAGKIVRELQDLSMSLRMVPLRTTFQKMGRVVRDVARKSGKQVELATSGEDTDIDRNMVDILSEPLVHMVRNSCDHGIETPADRVAAGKSPTGVVHLGAYHEGGHVVVEIRDDGRGLNRDKILAKAIQNGLVAPDKQLTDEEVFKLVFEPGFSTADQITDVSGRGVGMDVVKRSIERLKGRISIQSKPGVGTTFSIHMPLTLAITDGMLVKVGEERYIIPTVSISMSLRPEADALHKLSGRAEMLMLRGDPLPIFRLHRIFGVDGAVEDPTEGLLVIVGDGAGQCALLVDELLGQHQVVTKSLGRGVGHVEGISGGAILGDGRVGLIIDTAGVSNLGRGNRDRVKEAA